MIQQDEPCLWNLATHASEEECKKLNRVHTLSFLVLMEWVLLHIQLSRWFCIQWFHTKGQANKLKQEFLYCQDNFFGVFWKNILAPFVKFSCVATNHKSPLLLTNLNKGLDSPTYTFFTCPDNIRIPESDFMFVCISCLFDEMLT